MTETFDDFVHVHGLILNPDFQRGHVWTQRQQEKYVEYFLRGGVSGKTVYLNYPSWFRKASTDYDDFVCVDGLQRITALTKFWNDELRVFGSYRSEFEDTPRPTLHRLEVYINDLQTKKEVLQWYIEMNEGGTPHTETEIQRIKRMLEAES